ncbi:MAG: hypothetical protein V4695_02275 [Pseudomonadota bacterium]
MKKPSIVSKKPVVSAVQKATPRRASIAKKAVVEATPAKPAPRTARTKDVPPTPVIDRPVVSEGRDFSIAKDVANEIASLIDPAVKARKPKLVRDSFTMPEREYAVLSEIKKACLKSGYEVKKSELLRVGVSLISKMDIVALKDCLAALPVLKAGRPKKS